MATKQTKAPAKKAAPKVGVKEIVEATLDTSLGFLYLPESVYAPLVEQGLVEVNTGMKDAAGNYAVRATEKGKQTTMAAKQPKKAAPAETTTENNSAFTIEDGIEMPAVKRGGRSADTYPFDALKQGQSFFVPNTEDKPNAAKSLASTVSSANARYAVPAEDGSTRVNRKGKTVPVMVEQRKFQVRPVEGGARVWRVA